MKDWPKASDDALQIWNHIAGFWDSYMGDQGNDFHNQLIRPTVTQLLQPTPGMKILELGCGAGLYARDLDALGAEVVATDGSTAFLDIARNRNRNTPITFQELDVTRQAHWDRLQVDHPAFDAVVCNMMFMDVACVSIMCANVFRLLRPGRSWVLSLMHPCFNTSDMQIVAEQSETERRNAIKVYRYLNVEPFKGYGIRQQPERHIYFHRPLQDVLGALFEAGLVVTGFVEPAFKGNPDDRAFEPLSFGSMPDIPPAIVIRAQKPRMDPPAHHPLHGANVG